MLLPSKLQHGQNAKKATFQTVNAIIDYLKTQRISGDNKTIRVDQQTAGITLHAIPQITPSVGGGGGTQFDHPFKMKIIPNDEISANVLTIQKARIGLTGDETDRVYICYEQNDEDFTEYLELPNAAGLYEIVCQIMHDESSTSPNNPHYEVRVNFLQERRQLSEFTNSDGFFNLLLGTISGSPSAGFTIQDQLFTSSFDIYGGDLDQPFKGHFQTTNYPEDGIIIPSGISPNKLIINKGSIFYGDKEIICQSKEFPLSGNYTQENAIYCASLYLASGAVANFRKIDTEQQQFKFYDERNQMYNIPILTLFSSENTFAGIQQLWIDNIILGTDSGKLFLNSNDKTKDYLSGKITYPKELSSSLNVDQQQVYISSFQYIKGITINRNEGVQSAAVDLYDQIYWDYSAISGWNKNLNQQIYNLSGKLQWDHAGKIAISTNDQLDFLPNQLSSYNDSILFKEVSGDYLDVVINSAYFKSTDTSIYVLPSAKYIDFLATGKVRVNVDDDIDFLSTKFKSDDSSVYIIPSANYIDIRDKGQVRVNKDDNLAYLSAKFKSDDSSIDIIPSAHYIDFRDKGKVRVDSNDNNPGYLYDKITNGQFIYKKIDNNTVKIWTRALKQGFNIDLTDGYQNNNQEQPYVQLDCHKTNINTTNGIKKTLTETDQNHTHTYLLQIDYPNFALTIDSSISNLLALEKTASGIKIKSALHGNGIVTANNGNLSILSVPDGKAVLAYSNGYIWATFGKGIELQGNQIVNVCCSSGSESSSISVSVSVSESKSDSVSVSESVSISESVSVSSSVSESESVSVSVSSSLSESESVSVSSSQSESISVSSSASESESKSISESESKSKSESESKSISESESKSKSESESKSKSESESKSISESESVSASKSESKSKSESESKSDSVSASKSVSISKSVSTSESISTSQSESNSDSESVSDSGQLITCDNRDHVNYVNIDGNPYITGIYETEERNCIDGALEWATRYVFNGYTFSRYYKYSDGGEWENQPEYDSNRPTGEQFSIGFSRKSDNNGHCWVQARIMHGGGYGPYGSWKAFQNVGTYTLPWYDESAQCPSYGPDQQPMWDFYTTVIETPTAHVTLYLRY